MSYEWDAGLGTGEVRRGSGAASAGTAYEGDALQSNNSDGDDEIPDLVSLPSGGGGWTPDPESIHMELDADQYHNGNGNSQMPHLSPLSGDRGGWSLDSESAHEEGGVEHSGIGAGDGQISDLIPLSSYSGRHLSLATYLDHSWNPGPGDIGIWTRR